jgi:hypothetical protein
MASKVSRLAEIRWKKMRSEHADTLHELERARAMHPSGAGHAIRSGTESKPRLRNVTLVPAGDDSAA